ncbi:hypothetical protein ACHAXH_004951 [Discostella pseudostelligera]
MSKYRILSSTASAAAHSNSSSITASLLLFDDSSEQQQPQPSSYSRNDRPASNNINNQSTPPSSLFNPSYDSNSDSEDSNNIFYNNNNSTNHDGNNNNNTNNNYRDADDERRTISMTVFFLVFMVLYIGFCFYYQKKKVRSRVMDDDHTGGAEGSGGSGLSRREQRRENQIVLDESNNAARRARANAEAMIKYKQRKMNIEKALFTRLIVDDDDEDDMGKSQGGCPEGADLECAASAAAAATTTRTGVGVGSAPPLPVAPFARKIVTIQEEDSDIEEQLPSMDRSEAQEVSSTIAVMPNGNETDEHALGDDNASNSSRATTAVITLLLPPTTPPRASSTSLSQSLTTDHHHLANNTCSPSSRPSPLRSPSRRMMYADALNCGNHIHSRINACSNHVAKCSNNGSGNHGGGGNATRILPGCSATTSTDPRSISYSEMFSRYDEECNICLTQFQVGDSAAWSMQYGKMVLSGGTSSSSDFSNNHHCGASSLTSNDENDVCKHVFHEECISRWLLVRDGCPICRRSYFAAITMMASAAAAADGTSANATIDLERGSNSVG